MQDTDLTPVCHSLAIMSWAMVYDALFGSSLLREFTYFFLPGWTIPSKEGSGFHAYNSAHGESERLPFCGWPCPWNFLLSLTFCDTCSLTPVLSCCLMASPACFLSLCPEDRCVFQENIFETEKRNMERGLLDIYVYVHIYVQIYTCVDILYCIHRHISLHIWNNRLNHDEGKMGWLPCNLF